MKDGVGEVKAVKVIGAGNGKGFDGDGSRDSVGVTSAGDIDGGNDDDDDDDDGDDFTCF